MRITDRIAEGIFELKKKVGYTDEIILDTIPGCRIELHALASFFDQCVKAGEMVALENLPPDQVQEIRDFVKRSAEKRPPDGRLTREQLLQLGKAVAFMKQYKFTK